MTTPRPILFLFVTATALVGAGTIFTYLGGAAVIRNQETMSRQLIVINRLIEFPSILEAAEADQRGYLITGEDRYFEPYQHSQERIEAELPELRRLAASGDLPSGRVEHVVSLSRTMMSDLQRAIDLRKLGLRSEARELVRRHQEQDLMNQIRSEIGTMRAEEEREFNEASLASHRMVRFRYGYYLAIGCVNLGFLAWAFGRVASEMKRQRESEERLRRLSETLEKTVLERTASLRSMVGELQQVSYSIAHDMRAPLRAMGVFAGMLAKQVDGDRAAKENAQRIIDAAARLDRLILDSLNYTKSVLQEVPLGPVDLDKLLRGLIDTYPNLRAEMADIRIDGRLPRVVGNEALLTQCFSNLLANAVKFVAPGVRPQVRIHEERAGDRGRIWVEDNGIGIPAVARNRLFGMFQKLDSQYEGTGIGLAIVRKVTERMDGRIGVESEPGKGSRFWVELRLAPESDAPQALPQANNAVSHP